MNLLLVLVLLWVSGELLSLLDLFSNLLSRDSRLLERWLSPLEAEPTLSVEPPKLLEAKELKEESAEEFGWKSRSEEDLGDDVVDVGQLDDGLEVELDSLGLPPLLLTSKWKVFCL